MVKRITSSEKGATILLALLFFLMCAVAGSVVIAAGSASSGRVAGLAEQEQSFYTVSSSAKIVRDELSNRTMVVSDGGSTYTLSPKSELENLLTAAVQKVENDGVYYSDDLTISLTDGGLSEVTCEFIMNTDYSIEMTLYQSDDKDTYLCSIDIPVSSIDTAGATGTDPMIKWGQGTIHKGR